MKRLKEKIKEHFQEVLKIKKSPKSIAIGFTIGTFFGIAPTFGVEAILIILIILIFKKVSKLALLAAYVIWNPIVTIPLYALGYKIGDFLLKSPIKYYKVEYLGEIFFYSKRVILGTAILAILISIISYLIVLHFTEKYQRKLEKDLIGV